MKNLKTFDQFVNESLNEANISGMQLKMLGKKLLGKIKIGTKFVTDKNTYTVTGFGPKANAFQEYDVENDKGEAKKAKLTVMYGTKFEVLDDPRLAFTGREKEEQLNSITT